MDTKSVLVVEDNELWQKVLKDNLEALGTSVTIVGEYAGAVRALREGDYDLLILDNTLHEISNASVELIQAARRFKLEAPIIVYSEDLPSKTLKDVQALGATYVNKGDSPLKLWEAVLRLLGR